MSDLFSTAGVHSRWTSKYWEKHKLNCRSENEIGRLKYKNSDWWHHQSSVVQREKQRLLFGNYADIEWTLPHIDNRLEERKLVANTPCFGKGIMAEVCKEAGTTLSIKSDLISRLEVISLVVDVRIMILPFSFECDCFESHLLSKNGILWITYSFLKECTKW